MVHYLNTQPFIQSNVFVADVVSESVQYYLCGGVMCGGHLFGMLYASYTTTTNNTQQYLKITTCVHIVDK